MSIIRTHFDHVAYAEERFPMEKFLNMVEASEKFLFEKGVYKNGPTIVKTSMSGFAQPGVADFSIYIPTNIPAEIPDAGFSYMEELEFVGLSDTVRFGDHIFDVFEEMKQVREEDDEYEYEEDTIYLVLYPVYGDLFVEVILPVKEV